MAANAPEDRSPTVSAAMAAYFVFIVTWWVGSTFLITLMTKKVKPSFVSSKKKTNRAFKIRFLMIPKVSLLRDFRYRDYFFIQKMSADNAKDLAVNFIYD